VTTQRVTVETAGTECCNLFSGNRAGTRHLLPEVSQCTHRTPLGNRPTLHLTVAIMVAVGKEPVPRPSPRASCLTRSLESAWPPLYSIKSCARGAGLRAIGEARGAAEALAGARGATAEPAQVNWRRHSQSITVFEVGPKQPVLTGLKRQLRPLALGCLGPTASYPDLYVFDELRSTRPMPDEKTFKPFP